MTEVADRDAVVRALEREIDGGPTTGFLPARVEGELTVSFASVVVHAAPGPIGQPHETTP